MNLAEIQSLFYALVTRAPEAGRERIDSCFVGTAELPAAERIEIYANMYLWRQVDALREDFPKLARLLGDEAFFRLCEVYVREHPSQEPDLGKLGRRLEVFLRARPGAFGRPDLADLAALEWARAEVFFETVVETLTAESLGALGAEAFGKARVRRVPALRVLSLDHDAAALWRRLENGEALEAPSAARTALAVWRSGFEVFHCALESDEARALHLAAGGAPLAEVCAVFEGRESPARAAFEALASWCEEGWIAATFSSF